jgi:hypothetical protein
MARASSIPDATGVFLKCLIGISVACISAMVIGVEQDGGWQLPMYSIAGGGAYWLWKNIGSQDYLSRYLNFGSALLISCFLNRIIYVADFLIGGEKFTNWPVESANPAWDTFIAEFVSLAGLAFTITAWMIAGGSSQKIDIAEINLPKSRKLLFALYMFSVASLVIVFSYPQVASLTGNVGNTVNLLGMAACFLFVNGGRFNSKIKPLVVGFLSLPYLLIAVDSSGKEPILIALFPSALTAWVCYRRYWSRIGLISVSILALGMITNLSNYMRLQNWYEKRGASTTVLVQEVIDNALNLGFVTSSGLGFASFLERANAASYRGYPIALVKNEGYRPDLIYNPLRFVFIPRVFWPEKPLVDPGKEYTSLVFGVDVNSSTSAGFFTAFYLAAGWLGVLSGAVILGLLIGGFLRLARRLGGSVLVALSIVALFPTAIRIDEGWAATTIAGVAITCVYIIAIYQLARLVVIVSNSFLGVTVKRSQVIGRQ